MKTIKTIKIATIIFVLTLFFQNMNGQSELFGEWRVTCPAERISSSSIKFCDLCPIKHVDKSEMDIMDFEIKIDKAQITLIRDGKTTSVNYKWDGDIKAIEFEIEKNKYNFQVMFSKNKTLFILKSNNNYLLTLDKKM